MNARDEALESARRIVAIDEGWPGADEEIDYLDAVSAARGLLCCTSPESAGTSQWRALRPAVAACLVLVGFLLAFLAFPSTPGAMP